MHIGSGSPGSGGLFRLQHSCQGRQALPKALSADAAARRSRCVRSEWTAVAHRQTYTAYPCCEARYLAFRPASSPRESRPATVWPPSPLLRLAVAWTFSASVSGSEPRWDSLLSRFGGSRGYSRTWLETRVPGSASELSQGLAPASAGHNRPILPSGTHPTRAHHWHHSTHTQLQLEPIAAFRLPFPYRCRCRLYSFIPVPSPLVHPLLPAPAPAPYDLLTRSARSSDISPDSPLQVTTIVCAHSVLRTPPCPSHRPPQDLLLRVCGAQHHNAPLQPPRLGADVRLG